MLSEARRRRYWTPDEDRVLLAFHPGADRTLRDVASELRRSYYACRNRRKALRMGRVSPDQLYPCAYPGCGRMLPAGRKQGYCPFCRERVDVEQRRRKYERAQSATKDAATRVWERWTALEDAILWQSGATVDAALRLRRTHSSCVRRLSRLRREKNRREQVINRKREAGEKRGA